MRAEDSYSGCAYCVIRETKPTEGVGEISILTEHGFEGLPDFSVRVLSQLDPAPAPRRHAQ